MKKRYLYILWAVLYCACVGFSFARTTNTGGRVFQVLLSLAFFVPPYVRVFQAKKEENRKAIKTLRWISIGVLVMSMVLLALNIASVKFPTRAGTVLFVLLTILAPPLACGQQFALSLFMWACLMMLTLQKQCPCQK